MNENETLNGDKVIVTKEVELAEFLAPLKAELEVIKQQRDSLDTRQNDILRRLEKLIPQQ